MIKAHTIGQIRKSGRTKAAPPPPLQPQSFALPERLALAVELIQDGVPMAEVAQAINVPSVRALRWHLYRHGVRVRKVLRSPASRVFSMEALAIIFSTTTTKVRRWVRFGALKGRRNRTEKQHSPQQRKMLITEQAVLDFLAVREQWPSWEASDITDPDLRAEAERIRAEAGGHWVMLADWAREQGYSATAARQWVSAGLLVVHTYGRVYYVWSTDMDGWQPPAGWSVAWKAAGRPSANLHKRTQ